MVVFWRRLERFFQEYENLSLYPELNEEDEIVNSDNLKVHPRMKELYKFRNSMVKLLILDKYNLKSLKIYSHEVLVKIKENSAGWESLLPKAVASKIKKFNFFGYNK